MHTKVKKKDIESKQLVKSFDDVGGCTKAKEAISEIMTTSKTQTFTERAGVKMPKGVLLYGPPALEKL